jgi:hypothetical protein
MYARVRSSKFTNVKATEKSPVDAGALSWLRDLRADALPTFKPVIVALGAQALPAKRLATAPCGGRLMDDDGLSITPDNGHQVSSPSENRSTRNVKREDSRATYDVRDDLYHIIVFGGPALILATIAHDTLKWTAHHSYGDSVATIAVFVGLLTIVLVRRQIVIGDRQVVLARTELELVQKQEAWLHRVPDFQLTFTEAKTVIATTPEPEDEEGNSVGTFPLYLQNHGAKAVTAAVVLLHVPEDVGIGEPFHLDGCYDEINDQLFYTYSYHVNAPVYVHAPRFLGDFSLSSRGARTIPVIWHIACEDGYFPDGPEQLLHIVLSTSPRRRSHARANTGIQRLTFGHRADALVESHFGGQAVPTVDTSSVDSFDVNDDKDILSFVRRLPGASNFLARPVPEGVLLADRREFTESEFGGLLNVIHVKINGEVVVRFSPVGAHELYDLYRTLGVLFALERYLHVRYKVHAVSDLTFGYTLHEPRYPNILPRPIYEGFLQQNVAAHSFEEDTADAVVTCLRAGAAGAVDRVEVKDGLREVWFREFASLFPS